MPSIQVPSRRQGFDRHSSIFNSQSMPTLEETRQKKTGYLNAKLKSLFIIENVTKKSGLPPLKII